MSKTTFKARPKNAAVNNMQLCENDNILCVQFPRRNSSLSWMSIDKHMMKCSIPFALLSLFSFQIPRHFYFSTIFCFVFSYATLVFLVSFDRFCNLGL